jgi:uncharacterized protein (TIGR03000 family)
MLHPRFLTFAVPLAAAAAFLFAAGTAEAGGGGGHGGGGGGHGGGGGGHAGGGAHVSGGGAHVSGGGWGGGAVHVGGGTVHVVGGVNRGWGGNNFRPGFGVGIGVGVGVPGGYFYGNYPTSGPDYYAAGPAASYYVTPPATPSVYNVPDPSQGGAATQDPVAHILVKVPADAEVWFGQSKTSQTGAQREFVSPQLTPGRDFTYDIKARWTEDGKEVVQTRQIDVAAGSWKTVDFTKPAVEQLEAPKPKP